MRRRGPTGRLIASLRAERDALRARLAAAELTISEARLILDYDVGNGVDVRFSGPSAILWRANVRAFLRLQRAEGVTT